MYKILGSDGNHYGPVPAEQVRTWIKEGRANGQTMAQAEGAMDWKALATFPEFADLATPSMPPLASALPAMSSDAEQQVRGPATGLMVVGVIGFVLSIAGLLFNLIGAPLNFGGLDHNTEVFTRAFTGTLGAISAVVSLLLSALIYWGGMQMKALQNYPLVMAASILAIVPCLSPCCLLGLPIGIWALVILLKPEVKSAFH